MKVFLLILPVLLTVQPALGAVPDTLNSTCKISVESFEISKNSKNEDVKLEKMHTGTGTAYLEDDNNLYILTAGHVLDKKNITQISAEFFVNGRKSRRLIGRIRTLNHQFNSTHDLGVIAIKKTELSDYSKPTIIPLADQDYQIKKNLHIISAGCPNGDWPSLFMGQVDTLWDDSYVFTPNVIAGRSGSAIFDADGTKIIGVVIWSSLRGGVSLNLKQIYRLKNRYFIDVVTNSGNSSCIPVLKY